MSHEILSGNELIIQGGLEAGFSLYTGYPGSPLADYFNILNAKKDELAEKGIKVVIGNSEANAAAMASGAKQAGRDCLVGMKSMGLHVASDALSVGNFANPGPVEIDENGNEISPGTVIVVGDDPWSISTSTPADSRYLYKHLHIPFLEPSTPQELKDWIGEALALSKESSVYFGVLLTTFMAEGGGRVSLGEERPIDKEVTRFDPKDFNLQKNVMVPPNSLIADKSMIEGRFPKVISAMERKNLDQEFGKRDSEVGIISTGVIFQTLMQYAQDSSLEAEVSIYKLAASYPLVKKNLLPWLKSKKHLIVVEEKRGFLEGELRQFLSENKIDCEVYGKSFGLEEGFPAFGGLNYEIIKSKLETILPKLEIQKCTESVNPISWQESFPLRLPTFCPGCPHRETLSLLKELRKNLEKEGIKLISHGDVGCYSLSFLEPFKEMHNLSAMGQGGALGAGFDFFADNPSVVLMGDSTFFHSGVTDISNSVQAEHSITYIILDNDNTAMTGHQMTPVSGLSVEGNLRPRQDILQIIKGLGVATYLEVNPSDRYFYKNILGDYIQRPGVKVIVSNKECGLTFHSKKKSLERKVISDQGSLVQKDFYQINTFACEDCRECIDMTGCPGLTLTGDAYGTKMLIDPQICVADSYCTKLKACPSFEKVEVSQYHPTKYKNLPNISDGGELDTPIFTKTLENISAGNDWRAVVTGVGGSGVTTISRTLSHACKEMGGRDDLDFKFMDQKGLAQRNGRVTGHLAIHHKNKFSGTVTPLAGADLLLSPDLLDGSQAIQFLSADGLAILDDSFQKPLSLMIDKGLEKDLLSERELKEKVLEKLGARALILPIKKTAEKYLGRSVYASSVILGVAFQAGKLPFNEKDLKEAFATSMKKGEVDNNLKAFHLGRLLHLGRLDSSNLVNSVTEKDYAQSLKESFFPWQTFQPILSMFERDVERLCKTFPSLKRSHAAQYMHDIFLYNRGAEREDFFEKVAEIKLHYEDPELWSIALRALVKTYFIKDEVFVAHWMISPIKEKQDQEMWKKYGKKFSIKRINRPKFDLFGLNLEFDLSPKRWMLVFMRHFRILRFLLVGWHKREKEIASRIRKSIVEDIPKADRTQQRIMLAKLDNIKGYREIRYAKAEEVFFDLDVGLRRIANKESTPVESA